MAKTSINPLCTIKTRSAIELIQWPTPLATSEKHKPSNSITEKVLAIQTTRIAPSDIGGASKQAYQAFNLGLHVGDCELQVAKNRQYLSTLLPENTAIQWLEQVHGNKVAEISQVTQQAITADAAVTRHKGACLAIMTADCLPILLASKFGDEIAAIHGGWRPLAANIINETLAKMNSQNSDIVAWLGPCISKNAFEVGDDVKTAFVQQSDAFSSAFMPTSKGKYLADLHQIALIQLKSLGVTQISRLAECTYANTNKYYSYRKHAITGRMASLICLL